MTGDQRKLQDKKEYKGSCMVCTTNNTQLSIAHFGNTTIMSGNKSDVVSLHNVYHVPGIKKNLLASTHGDDGRSFDYENDWIVDSGYSNHMTGNQRKLQDKKDYKGSCMVCTTNNTQLSIAHFGNTTIMPDNKSDVVSLHNVYHMPGIKKNLLSVSQLTTSGNYVLFGPEDVKVCEDIKITGKLTIEERRVDSVYVLSAESAYVDKTRKNETTDL